MTVLRRYAPLWLVQLLGVLSEAELEQLQRQVQGRAPPGCCASWLEALDVLTADVPLVLEDLVGSDRSTVEALAYLAQRRSPARLWCWGPIGRWRWRSGRLPCAASSRSCLGGGRRWTCGWNSSPPRR